MRAYFKNTFLFCIFFYFFFSLIVYLKNSNDIYLNSNAFIFALLPAFFSLAIICIIYLVLFLAFRKQSFFKFINYGIYLAIALFSLIYTSGRPLRLADKIESEKKDQPNIMFLVIDTLRQDVFYSGQYEGIENINFPLTPKFFNWLQNNKTTVFTDIHATGGWTLPSVSAFMTGMHSFFTGHNPREYKTIAEYLQQKGYVTQAVVDNSILKGTSGFAKGFQKYENKTPQRLGMLFPFYKKIPLDIKKWWEENLLVTYKGRHILTPLALEQINTSPEGEPLFQWVHYMDPHAPLMHTPEGFEKLSVSFEKIKKQSKKSKFCKFPKCGEKCFRKEQKEVNSNDLEYLKAQYKEEVKLMDPYIVQVLNAFKEKSLKNKRDFYIFILSDHGEEYYDHLEMAHVHSLHREIVDVPYILVQGKGVSNNTNNTPVNEQENKITIDSRKGTTLSLAPTISGLFNESFPNPLENNFPIVEESILKEGKDLPTRFSHHTFKSLEIKRLDTPSKIFTYRGRKKNKVGFFNKNKGKKSKPFQILSYNSEDVLEENANCEPSKGWSSVFDIVFADTDYSKNKKRTKADSLDEELLKSLGYIE